MRTIGIIAIMQSVG
jgi:hypothetical protein